MNETHEQAVELLRQLGLKEYEANCFVALSRVPSATAKEISELSNVPRTRVYDATRVLQAQGLVEAQHTSPQQFRSVPLEEGLETLREQYDSRIDELNELLETFGDGEVAPTQTSHEVWSLSGRTGITNRTRTLFESADDEIVLVVGDESVLTEALCDALNDAIERETSVILGALTEPISDHLQTAVPDANVFISELEWLRGPTKADGSEEIAIGRLCMIDNTSILVSSFDPTTSKERAVFGVGFSNGLVVIVRRLMATGLPALEDPRER